MKCSICKHVEIGEYGNNAEPINDGDCCNWCNEQFVIPRRMRDMQKMEENENETN